MLLEEVLLLHESEAAESAHPDILGDPYLMRFNPLYAALKRRALAIGARYAEAWPEYLLFPFHQLGDIVAQKKIPYVPSGRLLKQIEERRPGTLTTEDLPIPESYHLHEASHVLAEDFFKNFKAQTENERVLNSLLCESFANTVDALACAYVKDETHRFFLQQNNYMHPNKKYADAILRVQTEAGERFTFIYVLLVYLHANFLLEKPVRELVTLVAERFQPGLKLSAKGVKDCEALRKMADNLDPQFRLLTTKVYLNLEGHDGDVEEVLNFPFMNVFDHNPEFSKIAEAMAGIL